jgi:hypothetical protein
VILIAGYFGWVVTRLLQHAAQREQGKRPGRLRILAAAIAILYLGLLSLGVLLTRNLPIFMNHAAVSVTALHAEELNSSLLKILADAGADDLRDLFDPKGFAEAQRQLVVEAAMSAIGAGVELYSTRLTGLLRDGRNVEDKGGILSEEHTRALSANYLEGHHKEMFADGWGSPFRIVPAPWPEAWGAPPEPLCVAADKVLIWSESPAAKAYMRPAHKP